MSCRNRYEKLPRGLKCTVFRKFEVFVCKYHSWFFMQYYHQTREPKTGLSCNCLCLNRFRLLSVSYDLKHFCAAYFTNSTHGFLTILHSYIFLIFSFSLCATFYTIHHMRYHLLLKLYLFPKKVYHQFEN